MEVISVFSGLINGFSIFLLFAVCAAILIVPLLMMKKPREKVNKLMKLLTFAAVGVCVLSNILSTCSTILVYIQIGGIPASAYLSLIGSLLTGILGCLVVLAFPVVHYLLKKSSPFFGLLLILPVITSLTCLINSATGMGITLPAAGFGRPIVTGIFCGILMMAGLAVCAVWYLLGRKSPMTLITTITSAAVLVIGLILSLFAGRTFGMFMGLSGAASMFGQSGYFFPESLRVLFCLLIAMAISEPSTPKKPQAAPQTYIPSYTPPQPVPQPAPVYTPPQPIPQPAPVYNPPVETDNSWMEDRTTVLPPQDAYSHAPGTELMEEDPGTEVMVDEDATGILNEPVCPVCGNPLPENAAFCPVCGKPLR